MRSRVAGIIEGRTGTHCEFCGRNNLLRAELMSNIEELFIKFLRSDPEQKEHKYSIEKW